MVMNASKPAPLAAARSAPFRICSHFISLPCGFRAPVSAREACEGDYDRTRSSRFRKVIEEVRPRQLKCCFGLLPRNALEVLKEVFQRLTGSKRVKQGLYRHAGSVKTRGAAD